MVEEFAMVVWAVSDESVVEVFGKYVAEADVGVFDESV